MKKVFLLIFSVTTTIVNSQGLFSDWGRKQAIVINHDLVEGTNNLVDFPFLVTLDHLNGEVLDGGANSALNGGGDIRFSSDVEGNNRLAIEIVEFVTNALSTERRCQIWVKVPNLSVTSNTTIYIWYNKSGESQPVATDSYGSQSVWSNNYVSVWHMEEDPSGTAPQIKDSGEDLNHGVANGTMSNANLIISKIGNGINLSNTDQFINVGNDASLNLTSNLTISGWFNVPVNNDGYLMAKRSETVSDGYNILLYESKDFVTYIGGKAYYMTDTSTLKHNADQWNYVVIKIDVSGTETTGFLNGAFGTVTTPALPDGLGQNLYFGARSNGAAYQLNAKLDELRVSKIARSNHWIKTEYNNQNEPKNFAFAGVPQSVTDTQTLILSNSEKTELTVDLIWTALTNVSGYNVYLNGQQEISLGSNSVSYQVTGLLPETLYTFRVNAIDNSGNESIISNTISITTNPASGGPGQGNWIRLNNQNIYYNAGNVGIGTTTPLEAIDVVGTANISEDLRIGQQNGNGVFVFNTEAETDVHDMILYDNSNVPRVYLAGTYGRTSFSLANKSGQEVFQVDHQEDTKNVYLHMPRPDSRIVISGYGDYKPEHKFIVRNGSSLFEGDILSTGKIGIGIEAGEIPSDYHFAVSGKIISEEVKVKLQSSGWPDYVFAKEYNLPTLKQLENYIKTHGHLPNIPSSKEVTENGIQLGVMNAKLLEKIEELTLYIIQIKKELEVQKEQIRSLKKN